MTDPTQPRGRSNELPSSATETDKEHFTLEQVELLAKQDVHGDYLLISPQALHALFNAAINDLIGEPVAEMKVEHGTGTTKLYWAGLGQPAGTKLYTLKKSQQETVSRVTAKISEEIKP